MADEAPEDEGAAGSVAAFIPLARAALALSENEHELICK